MRQSCSLISKGSAEGDAVLTPAFLSVFRIPTEIELQSVLQHDYSVFNATP